MTETGTALSVKVQKQNNLINLENPTTVDTIRNTITKGATEEQLRTFLTLAKHYNLNPFNKEIYFSGKIGVFVGRHGQLRIANRNPHFQGLNSCVIREKDEFQFDAANGKITKHITGKNMGKVIGAWAHALRADQETIPVVCWIDEFKKDNPAWAGYAQDMITYKAETRALRGAFNSEYEGITTIEPEDEFRHLEKQETTFEGSYSPPVGRLEMKDYLDDEAPNPDKAIEEPKHEFVTTKDLQILWTKVTKAGLTKEFVQDELISKKLINKNESGEYSSRTMLKKDYPVAINLITGLIEDIKNAEPEKAQQQELSVAMQPDYLN